MDFQFSNTVNTKTITKYKMPFDKINDIFGDGISFPCVFMAYGTPGSGKTTFMCQLCSVVQQQLLRSIACIGEMSLETTAAMCDRLNITIPISSNVDIDFLCDIVIPQFKFVIIDSLQMITYNKNKYKFKKQQFLEYCIDRIYKTAYKYKSCVGLIVQSTKTGAYKGSSYLSHMVDMQFRLVKCGDNVVIVDNQKNRMGKTTKLPFNFQESGFIFKKDKKEQEKGYWYKDMLDEVLRVKGR